MKASVLIKELQEIVKEHGDLPVYYINDMFAILKYGVDVTNVSAYDEKGEDTSLLPKVKIFLL